MEQSYEFDFLPTMRFLLGGNNDALNSLSDSVKKGGQYCPNYLILSSNLTQIQLFINKFEGNLARRNSRYALFTEDERFSVNTFLKDVPFFEKVLNLAVISMLPIHHNISTFPSLFIQQTKR